jgi:ADYC domain
MADGRPGWDYHQACTRLIRADYCGDGRSHTREGTPVEIIDRLGEAEEPGTGLAFEAGWTPEGASCVARHRLPGGSADAVAAACPARLKGRAGPAASCTLAGELARPEVLLMNKSRP